MTDILPTRPGASSAAPASISFVLATSSPTANCGIGPQRLFDGASAGRAPCRRPGASERARRSSAGHRASAGARRWSRSTVDVRPDAPVLASFLLDLVAALDPLAGRQVVVGHRVLQLGPAAGIVRDALHAALCRASAFPREWPAHAPGRPGRPPRSPRRSPSRSWSGSRADSSGASRAHGRIRTTGITLSFGCVRTMSPSERNMSQMATALSSRPARVEAQVHDEGLEPVRFQIA